MKKHLRENVEDWTKVGARIAQVESTNDSLRDQVQAFAKTGHVLPEGYSLRADHQTAGKGRLGRVWDTEPGKNLSASFLLSSAGLKPDQLFTLLQSVALAVRDCIASFVDVEKVAVKWPNDIFVNDEKVAGILIESVLSGDEVSYIIAGIGINVNQTRFRETFKATSLSKILKKNSSVDVVMLSLTRSLQSAQARLKEIVRHGDFYSLRQAYHSNLYGYGKVHVFKDLRTGREVEGKVLGVCNRGFLRLDLSDGEKRFSLDEVKFLRSNRTI